MGLDTLEAIAARVETLEGQVKEIFERLNDRESNPAVLATKLNSMLVTLGEVKQAVGELKNRPSRLWDTLITSGMATAIGVIAGILASHIH